MRLISDILILSTIFMICYGSEGEKEKDNFEHWPQTVLLPIGVGSKRTLRTPWKSGTIRETYGLAFEKSQLICGESRMKNFFVTNETDWNSDLAVNTNCDFNPLRIKYGVTEYALQTSPAHVCYGSLDCAKRYVTPQSQVPHRNEYSNAHNPIQSLPENIDFCKSTPNLTDDTATTTNWYFTEDGYDKCSDISSSTLPNPDSVAPRYLKDGEDFAIIRPFWYFNTTVPRPTFDFVPSPKSANDHSWKRCGSLCDRGQMLKLHMRKGTYSVNVALKKTCKRIKLCFMSDKTLKDEERSPYSAFTDHSAGLVPRCSRGLTMYILVDANTVIWATEGAQASTIELKNDDTVEFEFGLTDKSEVYVANHYREKVISDSVGLTRQEAGFILMVFDNPECLVNFRGIYSRSFEAVHHYVPNSLKVYKGDENINGSGADGSDVNYGKGMEYVPPVEKPDENLVGTTTIPPPVAQLGAAVALEGIISAEQDPRKYTPGKWWTWGLYFGFLLGTILTIVIVGAVVFLLRRTIYSIWYRGMFKRYGVDASGTAGGITGVGFGNTTTGAMTVSNTTGGGTTAGTTATSGTTGGDTTGGTTGGTSTIGDTKKSDTLAL